MKKKYMLYEDVEYEICLYENDHNGYVIQRYRVVYFYWDVVNLYNNQKGECASLALQDSHYDISV